MTISKEQVIQLLGDNNLSEDTIVNLKLMVEKAIDDNVKNLIEQKTEILRIAVDELTEENIKLKTAAANYGEYVKEEYDSKYSSLQEQAESYGEYAKEEVAKLEEKLSAQAESYAKYVKEHYENENLQLQESAQAYSEYVVDELSEKVDSYLDYVVDNFVKENEDAIVESVEYKRMKTVFNEMKESFARHSFLIDSDSAVDEVKSKLQESVAEHNKILSELAQAKKKASELSKALIFEQLTKDLADTQKDRVSKLVEKVRYGSDYEYKRGVELVMEEVITSKPQVRRTTGVLTENVNSQQVQDNVNINLLSALPSPTPEASLEEKMASYLSCLG